MRAMICSLMLFVLAVLTVSADAPPKDQDASANLPGVFHPYNVTGPYKGYYHCPISEHGLDPMVVIFHKGLAFDDPLPDLLKKLDAAIEKNPTARLGSFVVFLPDDLADLVGANDDNDDARLRLEKTVEQAADGMKLKHVALCLDSKDDVKKYRLGDEDLVTIVLCKKLKVVGRFALPKSEFTGAAVEKIMAAVADKLGAPRK